MVGTGLGSGDSGVSKTRLGSCPYGAYNLAREGTVTRQSHRCEC